MSERYPGGADQSIGDDQWILDVSAAGWVAVTKDAAIIRAHVPALRQSTLRAFALGSANITGLEMAQRVERHLGRMVARARRPGPWVDVVLRDWVERRWPVAGGHGPGVSQVTR